MEQVSLPVLQVIGLLTQLLGELKLSLWGQREELAVCQALKPAWSQLPLE